MSSRFTEQEMEIMKTGLLSRRRQSQPPENQELIEEIDRTRNTIEYELKAAQLRYQFLLRRFKLMEEL